MDGDALGEIDAGGGAQEGAHLVGERLAGTGHEDQRRRRGCAIDLHSAAAFSLLEPVDDAPQGDVDAGAEGDGRGQGAEALGNPVHTLCREGKGVQGMTGGGGGGDGLAGHRVYPNGNPAGAFINVHTHRNRSS